MFELSHPLRQGRTKDGARIIVLAYGSEMLRACGSKIRKYSKMVDEGRDGCGTEAVVDVDDGDAGRAGVQHAEQRGNSAE